MRTRIFCGTHPNELLHTERLEDFDGGLTIYVQRCDKCVDELRAEGVKIAEERMRKFFGHLKEAEE